MALNRSQAAVPLSRAAVMKKPSKGYLKANAAETIAITEIPAVKMSYRLRIGPPDQTTLAWTVMRSSANSRVTFSCS